MTAIDPRGLTSLVPHLSDAAGGLGPTAPSSVTGYTFDWIAGGMTDLTTIPDFGPTDIDLVQYGDGGGNSLKIDDFGIQYIDLVTGMDFNAVTATIPDGANTHFIVFQVSNVTGESRNVFSHLNSRANLRVNQNTRLLRFAAISPAIVAVTPLTLDQTYVIATRNDATEGAIYIDGNLDVSGATGARALSSGANVLTSLAGGASRLQGRFWRMIVYDRVLTEDEIKGVSEWLVDIYVTGATAFAPNNIANYFWDLDIDATTDLNTGVVDVGPNSALLAPDSALTNVQLNEGALNGHRELEKIAASGTKFDTAALNLPAINTLFLVGRPGATANMTLVADTPAGGILSRVEHRSTPTWRQKYTVNADYTDIPPTEDENDIWVFQLNGANSTAYQRLVQSAVTTNPGASATNELRLFGQPDGSGGFNGGISRLICYDRALTEGEIVHVVNFLLHTYFPSTYASELVDTFGATEAWALTDIDTGTVIHATTATARDGVLTGWDLQNAAGPVPGSLAPYSDAVNDFGHLQTASLTSALDSIWSAFIWGKVLDGTIWADGANRVLLDIRADSNNRMFIRKQNTNDGFRYFYRSSGASDLSHNELVTPTVWTSFGMTVNPTLPEVKFYLDGLQVGSTILDGNAWPLTLATFTLTSSEVAPSSAWNGWSAYPAIKYGAPVWTATDFLNMHNAAATSSP